MLDRNAIYVYRYYHMRLDKNIVLKFNMYKAYNSKYANYDLIMWNEFIS